MLKKTDDSQWLIDIQPGGRAGKRIKRVFKTQAEAKRFEAHIKGQAVTAPWNPQPKDRRKLIELIEVWFDCHGKHLAAGVNTKSRMIHFANQIKNPVAQSFEANDFTSWRTKATSKSERPIGAAGANRVLSYLRAMFAKLIELGEWKHPNPLSELKQLKTKSTELRYLGSDEIERLITELKASSNPHVYLVSCLAMSTGARWSESETITLEQLKIDHVRYHTRKDRAGGKWRSVPISNDLVASLKDHHKAHTAISGKRIFENAYSAFREAVDRAAIELPDGQLTHVLRHTFATSFLSGGGDMRTLQELLGHATIVMTMRYAHLVKANLAQAIRFNPLANRKL